MVAVSYAKLQVVCHVSMNGSTPEERPQRRVDYGSNDCAVQRHPRRHDSDLTETSGSSGKSSIGVTEVNYRLID